VLDLAASPALHLQRLRPQAREQEILDFLGGFDFRGERAGAPVAPFSGGEKARLALALVVWQQPNVLVLDEPTNHLDLEMREALVVALQGFGGALLLVSHDRHLLRNSVDELWLVAGGSVRSYDGDLNAYERDVLGGDDTGTGGGGAADAAPPRRNRRQSAALQRERLRPLRQAVHRIETELEAAQAALAQLQEQLADTSLYRDAARDPGALLRREGELRQHTAALEERWLQAQEALEAEEAASLE
jgi:ATP-binding cassette subfamily F protein 3